MRWYNLIAPTANDFDFAEIELSGCIVEKLTHQFVFFSIVRRSRCYLKIIIAMTNPMNNKTIPQPRFSV
jgi:hypothetical protein